MLLMRHADFENVAKGDKRREELVLIDVLWQAGDVHRRALLSRGSHCDGGGVALRRIKRRSG